MSHSQPFVAVLLSDRRLDNPYVDVMSAISYHGIASYDRKYRVFDDIDTGGCLYVWRSGVKVPEFTCPSGRLVVSASLAQAAFAEGIQLELRPVTVVRWVDCYWEVGDESHEASETVEGLFDRDRTGAHVLLNWPTEAAPTPDTFKPLVHIVTPILRPNDSLGGRTLWCSAPRWDRVFRDSFHIAPSLLLSRPIWRLVHPFRSNSLLVRSDLFGVWKEHVPRAFYRPSRVWSVPRSRRTGLPGWA